MKNLRSRLLNYLLFLLACLLTGTGLLLAHRLPPGSRGGRGLHFLALDRHAWGDVHLWVAYAFLALLVVHLVLHWTWLKKVAAAARPWRLVAGLGLGLVLVALFLLAPVTHETKSCNRQPRWGHRHPSKPPKPQPTQTPP